MGALIYADDITITCPSQRGLHKMLVLCNNFGNENYIIFNTKKTACVNDYEYIYFNKTKLDWYDKVRHLGNFSVVIYIITLVLLTNALIL